MNASIPESHTFQYSGNGQNTTSNGASNVLNTSSTNAFAPNAKPVNPSVESNAGKSESGGSEALQKSLENPDMQLKADATAFINKSQVQETQQFQSLLKLVNVFNKHIPKEQVNLSSVSVFAAKEAKQTKEEGDDSKNSLRNLDNVGQEGVIDILMG